MADTKQKFNKSFQIIRALENGLYKKYLEGDIVLQDIANDFNVTVQHVASIIKVNNIGNPNKEKSMYREEEKKLIKKDIENALPIECFKKNYKILDNLSSTVNITNTFSRWIEKDDFSTDIPYVTLSRLNKIISSINIMKYLQINNNLPKSNRESLSKIAKKFNVSYTKVANISIHLKKESDTLLPQKDDRLSRVIFRNLNIIEEITYSKTNHEAAVEKVSKKYNVDKDVIERLLSCEAYAKGASLDEYLSSIKI
ncbi:hypothetical protein DLS44_11430 [Staphylococcus pseudintermedius]|uniref:LysM peptidoglycan-binding domain-containing protein n=1 Tax=Staphylococcus pseudintermedius TaxID=283734 RepID=UPI00101F5DE8|nr:LysM peptidoglycan-binding domain-containing protein [Staphylococcus pseudintermedius]MDT1130418.1 LysM peptidoglycan-binding domain-containing protein [Staphylococcus pseudintermedius]RYS31769.1 hypothetical protein DLS44_11430 [Staphylococcus pseudintermedius]